MYFWGACGGNVRGVWEDKVEGSVNVIGDWSRASDVGELRGDVGEGQQW